MRNSIRGVLVGVLGAACLSSPVLSQEEDATELRPSDALTELNAPAIDPLDDPNLFRNTTSDPESEEGLELEDKIELPELPPVRYEPFSSANLRALDKITGRSIDLEIKDDAPVIFGSLRVNLKACYQTPPELPPEAAAFLEIDSIQATQANSVAEAEAAEVASDEDSRMFSGWMFASSPGLSALEHPVYDIWVINCTASAPVAGASGE